MSEIFLDGTYLEANPTWHEEDSAWKAEKIIAMIQENGLDPQTVCEIGCGSGEILVQLAKEFDANVKLFGYEISPQAYNICKAKSTDNLSFRLMDLFEDEDAFFDLVLAIDVFEHVEDYMGFLRKLRTKGDYKIFHIPLNLSVQSVWRISPIMRGRRKLGHIHYFTKETALATLEDTGYRIIDYAFTAGSLELSNKGWKTKLLNVFRKASVSINQDLAVRILGGHSLLVLSK